MKAKHSETILANDETLEDLERDQLHLIQKKDGFRFGQDSVFLAAFAASLVQSGSTLSAADLGAGCGAVSILLSSRLPQATIQAVEYFERPFGVLSRNIDLNVLSDRLSAVLGDVRNPALFSRARFDLIVSNPPYRLPGRHLSPDSEQQDPDSIAFERRAAVEMVTLSTDELLASAALWLKPRGYLALIQRPQNLPELLIAMRRHRIEPVALRAVVPLPGRAPSAILIAGRLHGRPGSFRYLPDLTVQTKPGCPSPETGLIYGLPEPSILEADAPDSQRG